MVSSASPGLPLVVPPGGRQDSLTELAGGRCCQDFIFWTKYFWEELFCLSIIYHASWEDCNEMLEDNDGLGDLINC